MSRSAATPSDGAYSAKRGNVMRSALVLLLLLGATANADGPAQKPPARAKTFLATGGALLGVALLAAVGTGAFGGYQNKIACQQINGNNECLFHYDTTAGMAGFGTLTGVAAITGGVLLGLGLSELRVEPTVNVSASGGVFGVRGRF